MVQSIRGQKVILDADLARLYGVPAKRLNEQVKRNAKRFPADFIFQLTADEADESKRSRSQIATLKRGENLKYLPHAFTETGAIMAANVLNSPEAVRMSVFVVRAFARMRQLLTGTTELAAKLKDLENRLTGRLDTQEAAIVDVLQKVMELLTPPELPEEPKPKRIRGFSPNPESDEA
jgi:uncharacterized membrane-anchored protein YjiN (DUF445 family)